MTRTAAALLGIFAPLFTAVIFVVVYVVYDEKPPDAAMGISLLVFIPVVLGIRIYCGVWYTRDKGRSAALGLMSVFGILGWLLLFNAKDDRRPAAVGAAPRRPVAGRP